MKLPEIEAACEVVRAARAKVTALDAKMDEARRTVMTSMPERDEAMKELGQANERLDEILGLAIPEVNEVAAAVESAS